MTKRWFKHFLQRAAGRGEFVVDMFAGGGGTSCGIEAALGTAVDIAINHDPDAIAIHRANHPNTYHFLTDVREVDPRKVLPDRQVGLLWLSPDCTHHSRAKGGKPVKRNRRALANVGIVWAQTRRPRVIILENVEEFEGWGPLGADGLPDKTKAGQSFKRWVGKLRRLGYRVEHKSLVAADYGAPTIRKRLFLIARRDGRPIVWPKATHAPAEKAKALRLKPWRAAAECIDWSLPARSIFERKKPLADATLNRIAAGIRRYVLDSGDPFIVSTGHQGDHFRGRGVGDPMATITASRDFGAVVAPVFAGVGGRAGQSPPRSVTKPLRTATGKADEGLVSPILIQAGYGERPGQAPRVLDMFKPLGTVVGGGRKHGLVAAQLMGLGGPARQQKPRDPRKPGVTQTTKNHQAVAEAQLNPVLECLACGEVFQDPYGREINGLAPYECPRCGEEKRLQFAPDSTVLAFLTPNNTGRTARSLRKPVPTLTTAKHEALTLAHLVHARGQGTARSVKAPLPTQTAKPHDALVAACLTTLRGTSKAGRDAREPMPSITAGGTHVGEVRAFLVKYFRTGVPASLKKPMATLSTKHRLGLVTVHGQLYQIVDIRLRMLTPPELLRAQFGRHAQGYKLLGTQEKQVKAIGNSVAPEVAEALVEANYEPDQVELAEVA